VLLLVRALFGELADDLFSESSGFREDVVESIKYLFQVVGGYRAPIVRHLP
jgi:hypothetical protein